MIIDDVKNKIGKLKEVNIRQASEINRVKMKLDNEQKKTEEYILIINSQELQLKEITTSSEARFQDLMNQMKSTEDSILMSLEELEIQEAEEKEFLIIEKKIKQEILEKVEESEIKDEESEPDQEEKEINKDVEPS